MQKVQIDDLLKEFQKLKEKLLEKDVQIAKLEKFVINQEQATCEYRIESKKVHYEDFKIKELESTMNSNKLSFDILMAHMKEVVEIYKNDTDKAKENLKVLEKAYKDLENEFSEEKIKLSNEINALKQDCIGKINIINEKYENYKIDTSKELNIRYLINKRQLDFIEMLKKQLKDAKLVIETPRIRTKYLNKLGHRNMSIGSTSDEPSIRTGKKIISKGLFPKNLTVNSSFSTAATPIYSNSSELDLNSQKFVGLIPEEKYY